MTFARIAALLPALTACSVALDFDPVGLPCRDDLDCPAPTTCGADETCREDATSPTDAGIASDLPVRADVVTTSTIALTSPVGLSGAPGALLAADLAMNVVRRVPDGANVCALPDTGVTGLAVVGTDAYTLHPAGLYVTRTGSGCTSERIGSALTATSFTATDGELRSLTGDTVERRTVVGTMVTTLPSWTLDPTPASPHAFAVDAGLIYVASTAGDGSGFKVKIAIYDAREDRAVFRRATMFDIDVDASVVAGVVADGDRLWILTAGSGDDALQLIETKLIDP